MALRHEPGARLRRAARGRAGFVALALALYLAAGAVATWPALEHANHAFLAGGAPGHGEAAAGDHLQTLYHFWLVGHQLEHGRAPWLDPYSFQPEAEPSPNLQGWPFGLPFWPLDALLGHVRAWNLFVLLSYIGAGGLACAWLRALGLARGAALAGGLAFALAPYRAAQSVGHLLGPISMLLPLALLGVERGRRGSSLWLVLATAAVASIPLSGQVHLALGAIPFFCAYALVRSQERRMLATVVLTFAAAAGAGLLVRQTTITHSILSGGRSLHAVAHYSAHWSDFVRRHKGDESERFVYLGWATPLLAAAGFVALWRTRRGLATVLGLGALVPILLALGTHFPLYRLVYHAFGAFRYPRVPERLMPIACLALAALVAVLVSRARSRVLVPALVIALLFVDLRARVYGASAADDHNAVYASLRADPPGRLLELPVFPPDIHYGAVYQYYDMQARRQRPAGYSTVAPRAADATLTRLRALNCGGLGSRQELRALGIRHVAVHKGLFEDNAYVQRSCLPAAVAGLRRLGFTRIAGDGPISLWRTG